MNQNPITVQTVVKAPLAKVWKYWNLPQHIEKWAFASDDWEATNAKNDLRTGGSFSTTMGAKDKSSSFEFGGTYTIVTQEALIEYDMSDGRHVKVEFTPVTEGTKVVETFDPEAQNSEELQRSGWQAIMDNFRKYTEAN